MVTHERCSGTPQLENLLKGTLGGARSADVARYIEFCEQCQREVEQLAPARKEVIPIQANGAELQHDATEQALEQAMNRLHADRSVESERECEQTGGDDSLNVLSPSDKVDSLGRLGAYDVMEILGRGGMGTVFKAVDTTLARIVAVKILSPFLASHGTARQRFVREAKSAAAVVHDHVITIHAVDETEGQPYLVMQFVPGMSLQEKIDRNGPLEVKEILRIAKQIASGLAAAHEQGLVHRDIKPSNILLENGIERVKITDFGLARAVNDASITHSEVIAGTPQYMAPEQAKGEAVDHRADLFSLGSVMYTMCTGRPPFRADGTMAVLRSVCEKRPMAISEINADIPSWLVEIIDRLHEKEPDERFQSAAEVERVLAERLADVQLPTISSARQAPTHDAHPVEPKPPSPNPSHSSWKSRGVAGLLILVLALSISELSGATNIAESVATVFRIETPEGTVVVELADPNATVTLDGEEIAIGAEGFKELWVKPGAYTLGSQRAGASGKTQRIVVSKGSKEIVKIEFEKRQTKEGQESSRSAAEGILKSQEHVNILKQRVKVLERQYEVGEVSFDRILRSQIDVLRAEMELATSPGDRSKNLKQHLARLG